MRFCGVVFPAGAPPRHLLPEGMAIDDSVAGASLPTRSHDFGVALFAVGAAKEFLGAHMVVPCEGYLHVPPGGLEEACVLLNQWGEERAARILVYEQTVGAGRETWVGLVAFEEDERALSLVRHCRDRGVALPDAHENEPPPALTV